MIWENLLDTLLNLIVFAFIGALVWLYVRDEGDGG
ncbi:hypothetical protein MARPU_14980 [Marichromatium purpuratum 984]|uniref:Uncharacterized protein n=1 Tax=Marichromatium purpuratum 984 TaxID=765910 RepID=W0E623_MARPU|nr:hypothetical protein MARPU_14980 [Marichromatium purpuratum 984]